MSRALTERIQNAIADTGGALRFDAFMQLALYEPGLGYYAGGARKFGAQGDFVTAPELGGLFAATLARSLAAVLEASGGEEIVELGAGSGAFAADCLVALDAIGAPCARYWIVEPSAELRVRQQALVAQRCGELAERVEWVAVPPRVRGVIFANEVADALPVRRAGRRDGVLVEWGVVAAGAGFAWHALAPDAPLAAALDELASWTADWPDGYMTEIPLWLGPWLATLSDALEAGAILLVDYGTDRADYYRAERGRGTLRCQRRHRVHDDPFVEMGDTDITADVEFTTLANAGLAHGLDLAGYTTQANFLLASGLDQVCMQAMSAANGDTARLKLAQEMKTLTLPGEMGERFKAMAFTRGIEPRLAGFGRRDLRDRLGTVVAPR